MTPRPSQAGTLHVKGHGLIHAVNLTIEADTFIVDDLGRVVGDVHDATCTLGEGFSGSGASGLPDYLNHISLIY